MCAVMHGRDARGFLKCFLYASFDTFIPSSFQLFYNVSLVLSQSCGTFAALYRRQFAHSTTLPLCLLG